MTGQPHALPRRRLLAILAMLAVVEFVWAPILSSHHHHSDTAQSQQCAVCVFASAHATPAAAYPPPIEPSGLVTLVPGVPAPPAPAALVCIHDQRGPPAA